MRVESLLRQPKPADFAYANGAGVVDVPLADDWCDGADASASAVTVEIVRGKPAAELEDDWHDLVRRADAPNVFMQPRILRAAPPDCRIVSLLAWEPRSRGRRLAGFWGFSIGRPHPSLLPISALRAPATDHAYLSAPVIDRNRLESTLHAMLGAIADAPDLPKFIALESMSGSGATYQALLRVLAERQSQFCRLEAKNRPLLMAGPNAASYLEKALSGSSRKKLRQHRRRLAEKGRLETTVVRAVPDVQRVFEAFLTLESKGWKGRRGTAILCCPDEAAFARDFVTDLAEAGEAAIYALELDGRPVSMQVVLRAGEAAYTWKTAYDEALSDFSPGMLLFEDYSKAFLADPSIAFADSCAYDDTGYMAAWTERKVIADLWIDTRRGGSVAFRAAAGLQRAYLPLREAAKQAYLGSPLMQMPLRGAKTLRQILRKRADKTRPASDHFVRAI
jgi:hypothetical protein